jgi:hypothetical protein
VIVVQEGAAFALLPVTAWFVQAPVPENAACAPAVVSIVELTKAEVTVAQVGTPAVLIETVT